MKNFARFTLLLLWLFAIVAPNVIILLDSDTALIVNSITEEEQQETGKKSKGEEKIVHDSITQFSFIAHSDTWVVADIHSFDYVDHTLEILLPPPERIG